MKVNEYIRTPRFGLVKIEKIYDSENAARDDGYTETTHYYSDPSYGILGKSSDIYHMTFAAYKKGE